MKRSNSFDNKNILEFEITNIFYNVIISFEFINRTSKFIFSEIAILNFWILIIKINKNKYLFKVTEKKLFEWDYKIKKNLLFSIL